MLIAVLYLGITSGIAVNYHFCMGKIASVTFQHDKDHDDGSCGKCGMEKTTNHCCKDETQFFKLTDVHQSASATAAFLAFASTFHFNFTDFNNTVQGISPNPRTTYFSPPLPVYNKVYLANNVFRI
jgi:hypothetical protein